MAEAALGARAPITLPVIACLLIVDCLWRLLTPGGPWPVTPWNYVSMAVDLLLLIGLVALWRNYPLQLPTRLRLSAGAACCWAWGRSGNHHAALALHQRPCLVEDISEAAVSRLVAVVA
jgi:hypothetical protein